MLQALPIYHADVTSLYVIALGANCRLWQILSLKVSIYLKQYRLLTWGLCMKPLSK